MNSYLITGGTNQERLEKASKSLLQGVLSLSKDSSDSGTMELTNNPDLLIIEPELSISIKQIREIQKFLSRKPYQSEIKAVVMPEAQKMTIPAQNSFLKTLEEPPKNSLIILCAKNADQLIATIVSRCQIIKLPSKSEIELNQKKLTAYYSLFTKILRACPGGRLQLIEPYTKNREEVIKFCEEMIVVFRNLLINKKGLKKLPTTDYQFLIAIKSFRETLSLLQSNVNVKLAIENLVINL